MKWWDNLWLNEGFAKFMEYAVTSRLFPQWRTWDHFTATTQTSALSLDAMVQQGLLEYVAFPDALRGKYQCYTQADLSALRASGCDHVFADVQSGVSQYLAALSEA